MVPLMLTGEGRICRDPASVPARDQWQFPLAVMEVKLQNVHDVPFWVQSLLKDHGIEAKRFSKVIFVALTMI